jgi:hypothetical protein
MIGFAVMFYGILAFFARVRWANVRPRAESDTTGTTIRPDLFADRALGVAMACGVMAMALFAVLQALGRLDVPIPHSGRYYLPFMAAVGALAGTPALLRTIRRGSLSYIRLSSNGFEFAQSAKSERGIWADVTAISDSPPEGPAPAADSIVVTMRDGTTPTIAVGTYTPRGRAVRRLVRFYWKHPDQRGELTTARAAERLRSEDFSSR